jgi:hypothetical protein
MHCIVYRLAEWARMSFKAKKCRSMIIKKGKVDRSVVFNLHNVMIPTLKEEPIKYYGKLY